MKAAVLEKLNKPLQIRKNLNYKNLSLGQVLVKIYYTGVCRSQIYEIFNGRNNKKFLPHLLGHEATGVVEKKHKSVKKVNIGDRVILTWIKTRGIQSKNPIYSCKEIKKKINSGSVTTFSSHSIVSENRIVKLDKNINLKKGVILGCAFPTGAGMIINKTKLNKKKNICFVGLGGVGISSLITSLNFKTKEIFAIDINSNRIKRLRKCLNKKINFICIQNKKDKIKTLHNLRNYFDYVIESSGNTKGIEFSLSLLKNNGTMIFASHPNKTEKINIDPFELIKGKKIFGSWGGDIDYDKQKRQIFKFFKKIKNYNKIFYEKEYNLENINIAIDDLKSGKVLRPIIKLI